MTVSLGLDITPEHLAPLTVAPEAQRGSVIKVLIVNNMPNKAATEEDACRFFGSLPGDYRLTFALPSARWPENMARGHALALGYAHVGADGVAVPDPVTRACVRAHDLILQTGSPIETRSFGGCIKDTYEVNCRVIDWAQDEGKPNILWCWSGLAGAHYLEGIEPRVPLAGGGSKPLSQLAPGDTPQKIYGHAELALRGRHAVALNRASLTLPVSRAAYWDAAQFASTGFEIVAADKNDRPAILLDTRRKIIACLNHPEYASDTLLFEFARDATQTLKAHGIPYPESLKPDCGADSYPDFIRLDRQKLVTHAVLIKHALKMNGLAHAPPENYALTNGFAQAAAQKHYAREGAELFALLLADVGVLAPQPRRGQWVHTSPAEFAGMASLAA